MRPLLLTSALLLCVSCATDNDPQPPPRDRFVFPYGIVHRKVPGSSNGALYVASANFDKCFDTGAVTALDLDAQGLPALGQPVGDRGPLQITELNVGEDAWVQIESFAGEMSLWEPSAGAGTPRLFVPVRAEGNYLHAIDIEGPTTLRCAQEAAGRDCTRGALSLTQGVPNAVDDLPRAPAPVGVSVANVREGNQERPEVWVTHAEAADSPARSGRDFETYVVRVPGNDLSPGAVEYFPLSSEDLSLGGAHATAIGKRYVYATGRSFTAGQGPTVPATFLLRLLDRADPTRVLDPNLGATYRTLEARGVAISEDERRLYIAARAPDTLLVLDVTGADTSLPTLTVVGAVPLPDGAGQVQVLPRGAGRGDLVVVTCGAAGVVALYDAELGQLVAQVGGVGVQPYGLAVDRQGNAARLYVSNFGDGRVAVIDIPNLDFPQDVRLVAHLGARQGRDEEQGTSTCQREEAVP